PLHESTRAFLAPDEPSLMALLWRWPDKVNSCGLLFAFQTVSSTSLALKTDTLGLAETDPIGGAIGTGRKRLGSTGITMISHPGRSRPCRKEMQGLFAETILLAECEKRRFAGLFRLHME